MGATAGGREALAVDVDPSPGDIHPDRRLSSGTSARGGARVPPDSTGTVNCPGGPKVCHGPNHHIPGLDHRAAGAPSPVGGTMLTAVWGVHAQVSVSGAIEHALAAVDALAPRLAAASAILAVGLAAGWVLGGVVQRLSATMDVGSTVYDSPLGRPFDGAEGVSRAIGRAAAYSIYLVSTYAATNALGVDVLSVWVEELLSILPALVAGVVILLVGFVVATYVAEFLRDSQAAARAGITPLFVTAVQLTLYLLVVVLGLDTMGVDVRILTTFARAFAFGLAGAVAIGLGVAFGLGSKDYVARNIEDWVEGARETATDLDESLELDDPGGRVGGEPESEKTEPERA